MKPFVNIVEQKEIDELPRVVGGNILTQDRAVLAKHGFCVLDQAVPVPSAGCRAVACCYVINPDNLTARKVIVKEINIAAEKAANEAAAVAATIERDKAAIARLEQMAVDITRSLEFRVLIALEERGEKTTEESVYAEVRKQLELPAK